MSDQLAASIAAAANSGATLRIGALTGIDGTTLTVNIGGGLVTAIPYGQSYTPILGDNVLVLQQGALNVVVDGIAGLPDGNAVYNPSFEGDAPGATTVIGWTVYNNPAFTGTATVKVDVGTGWGAKDGRQWLEINHATGAAANLVISSAPIDVSPGQRWAAVGYTIFSAEGGLSTDTPTMAVSLAFFVDAAGVYPTDVVSEAEQQWINGPTGGTWIPVRAIQGDGAVVPDGCTAARVLLDTTLSSGTVYWDQIIARRLDIPTTS